MSTNYNTCFIDSNGRDVSEEFVEKDYLLDVYPNLIDPAKAPALWSVGEGNNGALGNNAQTDQSSPVQTISGGTNWKQVSVGEEFTAAIKTDGTLWLWGYNLLGGPLGDNTNVTKSSPVQTVSGGNNWRCVSAGLNKTAAIKTDGTLWMWGTGTSGALGNNSVLNQSSPVQTVSAGTNWKQVSVLDSHTLAIKTDGTLWAWGAGLGGRLGNNLGAASSAARSSPVQTVSAGTDWKQVSAGCLSSTAIKTDGTLWVWGCNTQGQLGTNSLVDQSSPVQTISAGTNWKQVSSGINYTAAIKTDGTLWLWGSGLGGVLGNNRVVNLSSPVQTVSGGTNWKDVCVSYRNTMSIKTDGTLWAWGNNSSGILSTNNTISRSSPVQTISGGTNWKQVSVGCLQAAFIREEGDW